MNTDLKYLDYKIEMLRWERDEEKAAMRLLGSGDDERIREYFLSETASLIPRPRISNVTHMDVCYAPKLSH